MDEDQLDKIEQVVAVTHSSYERAQSLLNQQGWSVERAVAAVYDEQDSSRAGTSRSGAADEAEETLLQRASPAAGSPATHRPASAPGWAGLAPAAGWSWRTILTLPFKLLAFPFSLLGFLARLIRLRGSSGGFSLPPLTPRNPLAPRNDAMRMRRLDPRAAAERFVRSIEELTGAVRWSRRFDDTSAAASSAYPPSAAVAGSSGTSGSSLRQRGPGLSSSGRKLLPDFLIASYDEALRKAKDDFAILMVVLTSEEHDDDEAFKRWVWPP